MAKRSAAKLIAKSNSAFARMTPAQKRVAIAEDVVDQIIAERIHIACGTYFDAGDLSDHRGKDLKSVLPDLTCEVCAKGALFCSLVRIDNKFKLNDKNLDEDGDINLSTFAARIYDVFDKYQADLIEHAFEVGENGPISNKIDDDPDCETAEMRLAKVFGEASASESMRLLRIMKNIIKNKGTFKP